MAARLGLSPGLGFGQEPSNQPPSGLMPSVPRVGTPRSQPEGRGQSERVPDPSAGRAEATRGARPERLLLESHHPRRQRRGATLRSP
jgi:hypothetical protein